MASTSGFSSDLPADLDESRQPSILALYIVMYVAATATVALRFWARRTVHVQLDGSDYFILLALVGHCPPHKPAAE